MFHSTKAFNLQMLSSRDMTHSLVVRTSRISASLCTYIITNLHITTALFDVFATTSPPSCIYRQHFSPLAPPFRRRPAHTDSTFRCSPPYFFADLHIPTALSTSYVRISGHAYLGAYVSKHTYLGAYVFRDIRISGHPYLRADVSRGIRLQTYVSRGIRISGHTYLRTCVSRGRRISGHTSPNILCLNSETNCAVSHLDFEMP